MLPGIDGFETCRRLRDRQRLGPDPAADRPDSVSDRVEGLDGGADDYMTKPFSFAELLARLRALARRGSVERPVELQVGDLRLDPATSASRAQIRDPALGEGVLAILETFMRRPGEVLSRYALLEQAWTYDYENRSNVVDSYVRFLRRKIDKPFGTDSIETVRGVRLPIARSREADPDPGPGDPGLRRSDGGGAGRRRPLPLSAARRPADRVA